MPREGLQRRAATTKITDYTYQELWNNLEAEVVDPSDGEETHDDATGAGLGKDDIADVQRPTTPVANPRKAKVPKRTATQRDAEDDDDGDYVQGAAVVEDEQDEFMQDAPDDGEYDDGIAEGRNGQHSASVRPAISKHRRESTMDDIDMDESPAFRTPQKRAKPGGVTYDTTPKQSFSVSKAQMRAKGQKVHSRGVERFRGLEELTRIGGHGARLSQLFGPSLEDLKPMLMSRDHWAPQDTLPSRHEGGLRHSFYVNDQARLKETKATRAWLNNTGKQEFARLQRSESLGKARGEPYLANHGPKEISLLMGPVSNPRPYLLQQARYMSTAQPFTNKEGRRGWTLYLGTRIQEAQWAPNEQGSTQYVAVAVEQNDTVSRQHKPLENPQAPAFSATKPFPASIQIWSFDSDVRGQLDPKKEPRLELVICTDWGAPKQFRWCPIAPMDSIGPEADGNTIRLGLLAGVWSDGKVRILDVSFETSHSSISETRYIHYSKAAFEASFHNTIPTCLHWLSGTSLIVGTAVGTLAFWSLTQPSTFPPATQPPDQSYNPRPRFYRLVADTYILTVTSGYPSRPSYVSISIADGFGRLLDLRSPSFDIVNNPRGRVFSITQQWHEHTQSFLMPDENYLLRNNSIRRYYTNIYTMRTESQIVSCATSPVHPGVLLGAADGTVVAGNPMPRLLNYKEIPWQQIWFRHEWRRPVSEIPMPLPRTTPTDPISLSVASVHPPPEAPSHPPTSEANTTLVQQDILATPLTRITEGYRPEKIHLQFAKAGNKGKGHTEGGKYLTVYEEQSAVTSLAWNPGVRCGTWAIAGMGSGVLRVEDIGV